MASYRRKKEALRAASLAFLAGGHCITMEVEKTSSMYSAAPSQESEVLQNNFMKFLNSSEAIEMLADILDEEDLYPFGCEWPREALNELFGKLIPPRSFGEDAELLFRYRKGFRNLLNHFAASLETELRRQSSLDHWLILLLNTAFYAGATAAARLAENPRTYYSALQEMEMEDELWSRYPQLIKIMDRQLRRETRRRTGLVSDLDF